MRVPCEKVLVVGTGAMACLLACALDSAGVAVTMLGSYMPALDAIRTRGVHVQLNTTQFKSSHTVGVLSHSSPPSDRYPIAFVVVKSHQTHNAAVRASRHLTASATVVSLQNGVGNTAILKRTLPTQSVVPGIATVGAALAAPGTIIPAGLTDGAIHLPSEPALDRVVCSLRHASIPISIVREHTSKMRARVWEKLVVNAAINPVATLLDVPNGEILRSESSRRVVRSLADEAWQVAQSVIRAEEGPAGLQAFLKTKEEALQRVHEVATSTGENICSMLQDIRARRRTEIDVITGTVASRGSSLGIQTPASSLVWDLILAKENATVPNFETCNRFADSLTLAE